jgi:hypothetical protein
MSLLSQLFPASRHYHHNPTLTPPPEFQQFFNAFCVTNRQPQTPASNLSYAVPAAPFINSTSQIQIATTSELVPTVASGYPVNATDVSGPLFTGAAAAVEAPEVFVLAKVGVMAAVMGAMGLVFAGL